MKMKIPTEESSNVYESSNDSDHSDGGHQEGNNSPSADGDFSEYLWMENEEEFDKQILQQLEEEALMEHCIEVMLDHERDLDSIPYLSSLGNDDVPPPAWSGQYQNGSDLCYQMSSLRVQDKDELAKQSTLNPNAAEFVPGAPKTPPAPIAEKSS